MYKLKQIPEDFIVEETIDLKIEEGSYSYFLLEKKERTTQEAISFIAEKLHVDPKYINYAGTKDKQAITKQYISINGCRSRKDSTFNDISLKYIGQGKERINLGSNAGNTFTITIRNLDKKKELSLNTIINYFDEQRFSESNFDVGKLILKRRFKQACELIKDRDVRSYLEDHKGDYIGALRAMPRKILSLYINSVQSKIWNDCAAKLVLEADKSARKIAYCRGTSSEGKFSFPKKDLSKLKKSRIPLPGFGTELDDFGKIGKIIEKALIDNDLAQRDFIIREIPGASSEGIDREIIAEIKDFKFEYADDELNNGKLKCVLKFELQKGSYATIAVKTLFS